MITRVNSLFTQDDRHPKIDKNQGVGILGVIMHLAPADRSGYEVCPMRSAGCTASCLNTAGFRYARKENARVNRTKMYFENRPAFMQMMEKEICNARRRAERRGMKLGVRLNGTSDIPWENVPTEGYKNVMEQFPDVAFMDYTKRYNRKNLPPNYRLVFSRSEDNAIKCIDAVDNGMNVAVVFRNKLPERFFIGPNDLRVIDGDEHDWRYGDYDNYPNERVVIGLRAKGKGKYDQSGFVVDIAA